LLDRDERAAAVGGVGALPQLLGVFEIRLDQLLHFVPPFLPALQ
jgi:hypothetical protein